MQSLALFDLDHTLLPLDSEYEWGRFLVAQGAVDRTAFEQANERWMREYRDGTLDFARHARFSLGLLAQHPRARLEVWRAAFMREVIAPAILPTARALVNLHLATGDLCWPLPFAPEFYRSEFTSPIADMRNSVKNRSNAQSSCAAEFIHWHLDGTKVRWGHVDLAFPAFRGDRGTGFGVALLARAVELLARA